MDALETEHKARTAVHSATMKALGDLIKDPDVDGQTGPATAETAAFVTRPPLKLARLARKAIRVVEGPFEIWDVVKQVVEDAKGRPDVSEERVKRLLFSDSLRRIISNEISKLRYAKVLEVVEQGMGRRGGTYRRIKEFTP